MTSPPPSSTIIMRLPRLTASPGSFSALSQRLYSSSRTIRENDVLFLRQQGLRSPKWHLTSPLRADNRIRLAPGEEDYDLNTDQTSPPFEIFEAGTGMGSLTLHLARALHAANPAVPPSLRDSFCAARYKTDEFGLELSEEDQVAFDSYRSSRRAILHTLDRNYKHSRAAHKLVRHFRRSLYFPTIDFHVGSIVDYISSRLAQTDNQSFLSHAILDLPSAHDHASQVIQALHPNGLLIIFTPSISQIADFQAWVLRTGQPMRHERVIELEVSTTADGVLDTGGGKEWDVKTVIPRENPDGAPVQVMRPKVGDRISGGGFVAVMRRWPINQIPSEPDSTAEESVSDVEETVESGDKAESGRIDAYETHR
ncbi:hypothetical protein FGRMN_6930 [Fusarium graminum]|nr:hypothetical protein FGRMN_6930 [Fusarium graminum]